ncbi:WGxxGxxG family protein [Amycolatopsis jiangsuensis]|uniref:MYXO-CTERM domain-containing protein n=1 Tax=Amycolatopsis jiangsuensis TaxID=1181879 RepID=A0A840J813_9PSEU|nr:WGxxGxxG family protein [Amycolatopsis jiangsuensis]MBB4689517.1 hypothetical protein [Amycolatopsis jiangsuensis]
MIGKSRRLACALGIAATVPLVAAGSAEAAAPAPGSTHAVSYAVPAPAQNQDNQDNDNDNGDNGLWGLFGLVGLLGLAGLVRRGPKRGAMAGYPAADPDQAPPANTYPPASPRRGPPDT